MVRARTGPCSPIATNVWGIATIVWGNATIVWGIARIGTAHPGFWFGFRFWFWCCIHTDKKGEANTDDQLEREHVTCVRCAAGTELVEEIIQLLLSCQDSPC